MSFIVHRVYCKQNFLEFEQISKTMHCSGCEWIIFRFIVVTHIILDNKNYYSSNSLNTFFIIIIYILKEHVDYLIGLKKNK